MIERRRLRSTRRSLSFTTKGTEHSTEQKKKTLIRGAEPLGFVLPMRVFLRLLHIL
jgi:hypothetical protein